MFHGFPAPTIATQADVKTCATLAAPQKPLRTWYLRILSLAASACKGEPEEEHSARGRWTSSRRTSIVCCGCRCEPARSSGQDLFLLNRAGIDVLAATPDRRTVLASFMIRLRAG